jgi:hypothetical protein
MTSVTRMSPQAYTCKTDEATVQLSSNIKGAAQHIMGLGNEANAGALSLLQLAKGVRGDIMTPGKTSTEAAVEKFGRALVDQLELYTPMQQAIEESMPTLLPEGCKVNSK